MISPAIRKIVKHSKHFIKTPRFLNKIRNKARWFYLIKIKKNPYYLIGTKFLNESYNNIVRVDELADLNQLDDIKIFFGCKDTMVDTKISTKHPVTYLDGGHDLANTNTDELIKLLH